MTYFFNDLQALFILIQVGNVARIQQHVDILQERLLLDLMVAEQEDHRHALLAGFAHHSPDVVTPVVERVVLGDLNLEEFVVGDERRQLSGALSSAAADTCSTTEQSTRALLR